MIHSITAAAVAITATRQREQEESERRLADAKKKRGRDHVEPAAPVFCDDVSAVIAALNASIQKNETP